MKSIQHLAIVMDGNRRWAKAHAFQPTKGHEKGADTLEMILNYCNELGIFEVTLYTFSMQNFKRSKMEVDFLLNLLKKTFTMKRHIDRMHETETQVNFLGRIHLFDTELQQILLDVQDATKNYTKHKLNFCLAYGGREELLDAVQALAREVQDGTLSPEEITEDTFASFLYSTSEPDLIIRTGGDTRTSNFLPWQSVYSEWFFIPEKWPEMTVEILDRIFEEFSVRERRYGK